MRRRAGLAILFLVSMQSPSYAYVDIPQPASLGNNYPALYYEEASTHPLPYYFPSYSIDTPRLYLWGLTGSESLARGDALIPMVRGHNFLIYTDLQAKAAYDDAWMASGGAGYRGLFSRHIYGGYLFLDRNVSQDHNVFYVLSPGAEVINDNWDGRVNVYIPVSEKRKRGPSFFPSGVNACGIHDDCEFVEFRGHQQFEHRFFDFEEVGTGLDAEVGMNVGRRNIFSVHAGVYYFEFPDKPDIRGVEARLEIPFQNNFALTLEGIYDNINRGAVVGGLRIQIGQTHLSHTIADHFYDRIARNLSTINTGSGIITQKGRKDEGLFLQRDNIFFFTATGGSVFTGPDSGTFENPLRADQFTTANLAIIKAATGNGNFYFSPGTYIYGATTVVMLAGQSLYGRTFDYRCTAVEDERPILSFSQDFGVSGLAALIVRGGNNVIDSMILQNQVTSQAVTGAQALMLDVENNSGLFICNSIINADATTIGLLTGLNAATGILANNSNVIIDPSAVQAFATVTGLNDNNNSAVAIGANLTNGGGGMTFSNNNFILNEVTLLANTSSQRTINVANNLSTGIGSSFNGVFVGNTFRIDETFITARSITGQNGGNDNAGVGIGCNLATFVDNNFTLTNTQTTANALIAAEPSANGDNEANNLAAGLGSITGTFNNNTFAVADSSILANAVVGRDNVGLARNFGLGIGDILSVNTISNNNFVINGSEVFVVSRIGRDNLTGSNNMTVDLGNISSTSFTNNTYAVNDSSLEAHSIVDRNVEIGSFNVSNAVLARSLVAPNQNLFNIDHSAFIIESLVNGNMAGINGAFALSANAATVVNVSNSFFDVFAIVRGVDTGPINEAVRTSGTATFNIVNTHFNLVEIN